MTQQTSGRRQKFPHTKTGYCGLQPPLAARPLRNPEVRHLEKEARVPRPGFQIRAAESCGCRVGKESGKRDGTRGTGPQSPSCGSQPPASGQSPVSGVLSLSLTRPPPWPRARDPTPDASYQRQAEPRATVVGTAKAAAPCRGSRPPQGPRPPSPPWAETGGGESEAPSPGKVRKGPAATLRGAPVWAPRPSADRTRLCERTKDRAEMRG